MTVFWDSWDRPYRHAIVDAIRSLGPIERLLEGGCHCGPNLRLLRAEMPCLALAGFDVSDAAITEGRSRLPDVAFRVQRWQGLRSYEPVDVILDCYSLAYLRPIEVPDVLGDALGLARAGLVIAEPMPAPDEPEGLLNQATGESRHDYAAVFRALGVPCSRIERWPMPRWERLNSLLVVRTQ